MPAPAPVAPAGPTIVGSAQVTSGSVQITFLEFGGCAETQSFVIEYGAIGTPATSVEVPVRESLQTVGVGLYLTAYGPNSVVAFARCSDGSTSEPSNKVDVIKYVTVIPPPTFYLAPNGVTILCPSASVGDTGVVGGVTYTKRDRDGLLALKGTANEAELVTSCTSGVTNMGSLLRVRVPPRCCYCVVYPINGSTLTYAPHGHLFLALP